MRVSAGIDGLAAALGAASSKLFDVVDDEVAAATEGLKADLRQQTGDALGAKVANAWRGRFYGNKGDPKGPAAFVWSKAPRIIDFFSASKLVTPLGAAFAIPTDNVPRGARGRRLTPIEVEARFNVELQVIPLKTGRLGLFMDAVSGRSRRRPGIRAATARRRGQGRQVRKILMFVLFRGPLRGEQLIDLDAVAVRWGARIVDNIGRKLGS